MRARLTSYSGGNSAKLQIFLIISTCFLYLVAAGKYSIAQIFSHTDRHPGLFSKAIWFLQNHQWSKIIGGDAAETGSGPGSYDIRQSVWHVNCCNPELNGGGGWGIFNALFGWQNSATYGSVIGYNVFWIVVMLGFGLLRFKETKGRWPWGKATPATAATGARKHSDDETSDGSVGATEKHVHGTKDTELTSKV